MESTSGRDHLAVDWDVKHKFKQSNKTDFGYSWVFILTCTYNPCFDQNIKYHFLMNFSFLQLKNLYIHVLFGDVSVVPLIVIENEIFCYQTSSI